LPRDTALGFDFTGINFYDGQGFMVRADAGVRSARELDGATICVQPGTTTEQNLTDWARTNRIRFTPVVIERLEEVVQTYVAGRCDAFTTDVSGLASTRSAQPNPRAHVILPDVISKEPLGPLIRHGDQRFADLLRWIHFGQVGTEELGVTSANLAQRMEDPNPEVQRLLGRSGDLGRMLGVDNAFMANIIRALGNYGESSRATWSRSASSAGRMRSGPRAGCNTRRPSAERGAQGGLWRGVGRALAGLPEGPACSCRADIAHMGSKAWWGCRRLVGGIANATTGMPSCPHLP
jgi:general L-amino acid transport system substrate-binding protein